MRRCLVKKLACPQCRGDIALAEVKEKNDLRVVHGILQCQSCAATYPIDQGVPRLIHGAADRVGACRRIAFPCESGFDDEMCIAWVKEQLEIRRDAERCAWLLDAGCGSGAKTQMLASRLPAQNVVGVDLDRDSLEGAMSRFGAMANLDFVQGDFTALPFKDEQFDAGMSLGAMQHTADTRQAFADFRRTLKKVATCVLWIHPTYWEGPEWRLPYFVRDVFTFGQSHRLPAAVLGVAAHAFARGLSPVAQFFLKERYRRIGRDLPFLSIDGMTRQERLRVQASCCLAALLPRYQWRHKVQEVRRWFVAAGLDPLWSKHGFYTASSVPIDAGTTEVITGRRVVAH